MAHAQQNQAHLAFRIGIVLHPGKGIEQAGSRLFKRDTPCFFRLLAAFFGSNSILKGQSYAQKSVLSRKLGVTLRHSGLTGFTDDMVKSRRWRYGGNRLQSNGNPGGGKALGDGEHMRTAIAEWDA